MNCKPGDLAIYVKGWNSGKMVTCIELVGKENMYEVRGRRIVPDPSCGPIWRTDRASKWMSPSEGVTMMAPYACDSMLMPIRPEPDPEGEDESVLDPVRTEANIRGLLDKVTRR